MGGESRPGGGHHRGEEALIPLEGAPCPFCQRCDTELVNPFGGALSVAQYWCRECRTGFEFIKWEEHEPGY
jgi:hypothetical protein